ncbi:MAG: helix-turn-helix domain-containing protein [Clostridium fessum]
MTAKYGTSSPYSKRIAFRTCFSVTATAQKVGIHRNTIEYRLRKFNDLSGISENYTADITCEKVAIYI